MDTLDKEPADCSKTHARHGSIVMELRSHGSPDAQRLGQNRRRAPKELADERSRMDRGGSVDCYRVIAERLEIKPDPNRGLYVRTGADESRSACGPVPAQ